MNKYIFVLLDKDLRFAGIRKMCMKTKVQPGDVFEVPTFFYGTKKWKASCEESCIDDYSVWTLIAM